MEKGVVSLGIIVLSLVLVSGVAEAQSVPGGSLWQGRGSGSTWQNPISQNSGLGQGGGFTSGFLSKTNGSESGNDHSQPKLVPENSTKNLLLDSAVSVNRRIGVNFYKNPKVVSRNYVLSKEDASCIGEALSLNETNSSGEWYKKGGPTDSPPIEWVNDIEAVKAQIIAGTFNTKVYLATLCSWRRMQESETGPERCVFTGNLICQEKCTGNMEGQNIDTSSAGEVDVNVSCTPDCLFFINRGSSALSQYPAPDVIGGDAIGGSMHFGGFATASGLSRAYGYLVLSGEKLPTLKYSQKLKIIDNSSSSQTGPNIEVTSSAYSSMTVQRNSEPLRFTLKNTGDTEAIIEEIALNVPFRIVYAPTIISPGKEEEAVLELTAESSTDLELIVNYRSSTLGCLAKKNFELSYRLGRLGVLGGDCIKDSDCPAKQLGLAKMVCFNGLCRDPTKGFSNDIDGDGQRETWTQYS